jgi:hypothetical protein
MGAVSKIVCPSFMGGQQIEAGNSHTSSQSLSSLRKCSECGGNIPATRLRAVPTAVLCVPCLETAGDVPRIQQFSERTKDGDVITTQFRSNHQIETQLRRVLSEVAPDGVYRVMEDEYGRPSSALLQTVPIQDVMTER